ncbi:MAG: hypothetical protein ABFD23_05650 [Caldisericales bacterium]
MKSQIHGVASFGFAHFDSFLVRPCVGGFANAASRFCNKLKGEFGDEKDDQHSDCDSHADDGSARLWQCLNG